jgi:hypothetical protein
LAGHIRANTEPEIPDYQFPPPEGATFPTLADLQTFGAAIIERQEPCISYDIENAGPFLLCIGMYILDLADWSVGPGLCLPFKLQHGRDYWQHWGEHLTATKWLYELLADPSVANVFHNGVTHDVPMLEELGFKVEGRLLDTMVIAHYLYPEMRKSLQYLSTLYLGAGVWKDLVKEDEDE